MKEGRASDRTSTLVSERQCWRAEAGADLDGDELSTSLEGAGADRLATVGQFDSRQRGIADDRLAAAGIFASPSDGQKPNALRPIDSHPAGVSTRLRQTSA